MRIPLSDGSFLDLADDTPQEAIKNHVARIEAKIKDGSAKATPPSGTGAPATTRGNPLDNVLPVHQQAERDRAARAKAKSEDELRRGIVPLDPNSFRLKYGGDKYSDIPLPPGLAQTAASAVDYVDKSIAPLARGAVAALPGMAADAVKWIYDRNTDQPTDFGSVTKTMQDAMAIEPRDPQAGFGTDVMEAMGGGLLGRGLAGGRAIASGVKGSIAREVPVAVTSTAGANAGTSLAEEIFGKDSVYGKAAGGLIGGVAGGTVPSVASAAVVKPAARLAFAQRGPLDADGRTPSRAAYDNWTGAGIRPTTSMIGNETAARVSNTIAKVPFVGNSMQERFNQSYRDFQQRLYDAAFGIAGRNGGQPVPLPLQQAPKDVELGRQMRVAAREGQEDLTTRLQSNYDQFYDDMPSTTLVQPNAVDAEINRQGGRLSGELPAARQPVIEWREQNLTDQTVGGPGPSLPGTAKSSVIGVDDAEPRRGPVEQGPMAPGEPYPGHSGVPIGIAGKAVTEAAPGPGGVPVHSGALTQAQQALKSDIDRALMEDPAMVKAYPNEADRLAQIERLRVLHTEYAMSKAKDVSRGGGEIIDGRFYVGGDEKALKSIAEPTSDRSAFAVGSVPDNMAVLQRNMPQPGTSPNLGTTSYGDLAGGTILQKSQAATAKGPINISPEVFSAWWQNLDPNARMILSNEGYDPRRSFPVNEPRGPAATPRTEELDRLSRVGNDFARSRMEANLTNSGNTAGALALLTGLITTPKTTIPAMAAGAVGSKIMQSDALARAVAGVGPTTLQEILSGLVSASGSSAALANQPDNEQKRPPARITVRPEDRR